MYKYNTDKSPCSNCLVRACCTEMCQEFLDHIPKRPSHIVERPSVAIQTRDVLPAFLRDVYDKNLKDNDKKGFSMHIFNIHSIAYQRDL